MELSQHLQLKQTLTPQQILLSTLLQLPSMALELRIKTELEINPLLELEDDVLELDNPEEEAEMQQGIMAAVRSHFRPEFINRLDDVLIFNQLTKEVMKPIVKIQLKRLKKLMMDREIELVFQDEVLDYLAEEGYNPMFGARPLKRVIQARIQDFLADKIIQGEITDDSRVQIYLDEDMKIACLEGDGPVPQFERAVDPELPEESQEEQVEEGNETPEQDSEQD